MKDIVLIGFGGHAKSVIDSIESSTEYRITGYTDAVKKEEYRGCRYLGTDKDLLKLYETGIRYAFVTIGFMGKSDLRKRLYEQLKRIGYEVPYIIDSSAVVCRDAIVEEGVYIGKRAVVNSGAYIGKMSIINTGSIVEHENVIGAFSHVAVGVNLCGNVEVGEHCFIGAGSTIIQGCKIGSNAIVGAGSIVLADVEEGQKAIGVIKRQGS